MDVGYFLIIVWRHYFPCLFEENTCTVNPLTSGENVRKLYMTPLMS